MGPLRIIPLEGGASRRSSPLWGWSAALIASLRVERGAGPTYVVGSSSPWRRGGAIARSSVPRRGARAARALPRLAAGGPGALCATDVGKGGLFLSRGNPAPLWRVQGPQRGGLAGEVFTSPAFV